MVLLKEKRAEGIRGYRAQTVTPSSPASRLTDGPRSEATVTASLLSFIARQPLDGPPTPEGGPLTTIPSTHWV